MKQGGNLNDDEAVILCCFADFLDEDGMGVDELCTYIMHCGIKIPGGMTVGDAILAHYRNPIGYDIDRAAMDLRTWPPIAERILELQTAEAERRAAGDHTAHDSIWCTTGGRRPADFLLVARLTAVV